MKLSKITLACRLVTLPPTELQAQLNLSATGNVSDLYALVQKFYFHHKHSPV